MSEAMMYESDVECMKEAEPSSRSPGNSKKRSKGFEREAKLQTDAPNIYKQNVGRVLQAPSKTKRKAPKDIYADGLPTVISTPGDPENLQKYMHVRCASKSVHGGSEYA